MHRAVSRYSSLAIETWKQFLQYIELAGHLHEELIMFPHVFSCMVIYYKILKPNFWDGKLWMVTN